MSDHKLNIVGFIRTANGFTLKDAVGGTYDCSTPQELWDDLMRISNDKSLPGSVVTEQQVDAEEDEDLLSDACAQVRETVASNHGRFFGYVASEMTRKMAPITLRTLRNISKRDRFNLRSKKAQGSE